MQINQAAQLNLVVLTIMSLFACIQSFLVFRKNLNAEVINCRIKPNSKPQVSKQVAKLMFKAFEFNVSFIYDTVTTFGIASFMLVLINAGIGVPFSASLVSVCYLGMVLSVAVILAFGWIWIAVLIRSNDPKLHDEYTNDKNSQVIAFYMISMMLGWLSFAVFLLTSMYSLPGWVIILITAIVVWAGLKEAKTNYWKHAHTD